MFYIVAAEYELDYGYAMFVGESTLYIKKHIFDATPIYWYDEALRKAKMVEEATKVPAKIFIITMEEAIE